jgi:flagellar basal body-associated protein FliL
MADQDEIRTEEGGENAARKPKVRIITLILLVIAGLALVILTSILTVYVVSGQQEEEYQSLTAQQDEFADHQIETNVFEIGEMIITLDPDETGEDSKPTKVRMNIGLAYSVEIEDEMQNKLPKQKYPIEEIIRGKVASKSREEMQLPEQEELLKLEIKEMINNQIFSHDEELKIVDVHIVDKSVY